MIGKDNDIDRISKKISQIINACCNTEAIENITKSGYTKVMIENFDDDFSHYLYNHYKVAIVDYQIILTINK